MQKILFFILIPFLLFGEADLHFIGWGRDFTCPFINNKTRWPNFILNRKRTGGDFYYNKKHYFCASHPAKHYNYTCLSDQNSSSKVRIRITDDSIYPYTENEIIYFAPDSYCLRSSCPNYSKDKHMCLDKENNPVCPNNEIYNSSKKKCEEAPKCNLTCTLPKILNIKLCQCKCPPPMINGLLGRCAPNPNLNKDECKKAGGVYMENNILGTFRSIDNTIASLYAPPIGAHYCYNKAWADAKKKALKAKITPKALLSTALNILPLGKLVKLAKWAGIGDKIIEATKSPKILQDNKPIIETKYNPKTGTFEPVVDLQPRQKPLPPEDLLTAPKDVTNAEKIVKPSKNLDDFFASDWANIKMDKPTDMNDAVIAYDMERGNTNGASVATVDDLREIFNRSAPDTSRKSFPAPIKDYVGEEGSVPTTVEREVTPVNTTGRIKTYKVKYNITPDGASAPLTVVYNVEVSPNPDNAAKPLIKATPTYTLGDTKKVGTLTIVNKPPVKDNSNNTPNKNNNDKVDYTSFTAPAENAIKNAFAYKFTLFTCPNVTPQCPHKITINYDNDHVKGKYSIPDPMCGVITTINNENISPWIDKAGDLIVLLAGILGALALFRRN